jgi:hypothetical protein
MDEEQQDKGKIEDSSRHILHSLTGIPVWGFSLDNDKESRSTKNRFYFIFFKTILCIID